MRDVETTHANAHVRIARQVDVLHKDIVLAILFELQDEITRHNLHVRFFECCHYIVLKLYLLVPHELAWHCCCLLAQLQVGH